MKVKTNIFILNYLSLLCLGKDAYDVAVEKEFDECKETVAKTLEKRGIKAGVKPNSTASTGDKLSDDLEKLKVKR